MNIFVSNISRSATNFQLNKLFSEYGDVISAKIVIDKITEESRGFGFVEMKELSAAQKAIDSLKVLYFWEKPLMFLGQDLVRSDQKETLLAAIKTLRPLIKIERGFR